MEGLAVLLGLGLIVCVFVLPIAAFVRSGSTRRELEAMRTRLSELTLEVARLSGRGTREDRSGEGSRAEAEAGIAPAQPPAAPAAEGFRLETLPRLAKPAPAGMPGGPIPAALEALEGPMAPPPLLSSTPSGAMPLARPAQESRPTSVETPSQAQAAVPPALPPALPPMPSAVPPGAPPGAVPSTPAVPPFNWERFMGAKLFAWLGGFALFLAAAYFVKYSFERNLIPPEVRVAFGFLLGIGLIAGGFVLRRKEYAVTAQTLCATGVVILYAVTFACRAVYHFALFGPGPTFLIMTLITAAAFLLAVRMDAMVVAILGMLGGFLTPVLLSTGQDNPVGLFSYIALIDLGLIAVALVRPWPFLVALAALGTVGLQFGWSAKFFAVEKLPTAVVIFLGFDALFLAGWETARRRVREDVWWRLAAAGLPVWTLLCAFPLLGYPAMADHPGLLGGLVLGADLCLLAMVLRQPFLAPLHLAGGVLANLFLAAWTVRFLSDTLLWWGLGGVFLFALLHSVFPILLARLRPESATPSARWAHFFPPAALLLMFLPLFKLASVSIFIWPIILAIDLLAVGLALLTASMFSVVAVLGLTVLVAAAWILHLPTQVTDLSSTLVIVAGIAAVFFFASLFVWRRLGGGRGTTGTGPGEAAGGAGAGELASREAMLAHLPAASALLPFLLLILITARLPLVNPSPVFALALALTLLLLSIARTFAQPVLTAVSLGSVLLLQLVWQGDQLNVAENAGLAVAWHVGFALVFLFYPFLSRQQCPGTLPWAVGALSLPLHFALVYQVVRRAWPNPVMGLLPAAAAVPLLASLALLLRWFPAGHLQRDRVLAWFGGAALFFITLIFPIQFERQWITVGWALEGAALCWLFHRVPHPGLRLTGLGLLVAAFARLALNPEVLGYHPRSATGIWNWYLYGYGLTALCLLGAARLLAPPRDRIQGLNAPGLLNALATVLVFLLLNIEIADYFTAPGQAVLNFQFSGNFARDMTYTIAWALFALGLLVVGIRWRAGAARHAGLGLLAVALLKLFLHDLSQLNQLYRIGALAAVAVIAIFASFLYQKFLATEPPPSSAPPGSNP